MIINYFEKLAEQYNSENKCGFCWSFGAPLSESAMNKQLAEEGKQCCINLFVTDYQISSFYKVNDITGLTNYEACDHRFTLYAVQQREDIGQNTFNEIPGHNIDTSLWRELLQPLQDCLGCEKELYECMLGYDFQVLAWDMVLVKFKEDRNLTGWKISGRFRVPALNTYKPVQNLHK